jgi:hypothetical protein
LRVTEESYPIIAKSNLRLVVRLVLLFSLIFALSLTECWVPAIGSSLSSSRTDLHSSTGQVSIYDGAFFNSGDVVSSFSWFGPTFSGSKDLAPLLFQDDGGAFTAEAIGAAQVMTYTRSAQTVSLGLEAGSLTAGTNHTFGFVAGLADSTGALSGGSTGFSIDFSPTVDTITATASGAGTNDWVFTPTDPDMSVALSDTFGGDGTPLNSGTGSFKTNRTYSAHASTSPLAEPGMFSLIMGAGLILAGLFRYRYTRGCRS